MKIETLKKIKIHPFFGIHNNSCINWKWTSVKILVKYCPKCIHSLLLLLSQSRYSYFMFGSTNIILHDNENLPLLKIDSRYLNLPLTITNYCLFLCIHIISNEWDTMTFFRNFHLLRNIVWVIIHNLYYCWFKAREHE